MKTPREILLRHHQAATAKLDQIRRIFVADLSPGSALGSVNSEINAKAQRRKDAEAEGAQVGSQIERLQLQLPESALAPQETSSLGVFASLRLCVERLPQKLWRELIWPARRIWVGFAAVWLVILLVNVGDYERSELAGVSTPPSSKEIQMAREQQNQMLSELLESTWIEPAEPATPPRRNPQPRSERRLVWAIG